MKKFLLDIVVFISGAVVMILELTGSRILAPHVGGSLPVWTGLIGVILGSLSLGYMFGGKLADKNPTYNGLAAILSQSALTLAVIPIVSKIFLPIIITTVGDLKLATVVSTIVLFALPSVFLGMVSPYAIRLKLESVTTSGQTAGRLYAVSTVGSIIGTFFAGFFLIAFLGSHTILYLLAAAMFVLSALVMGRGWLGKMFYLLPLFFILSGVDFFYFSTFNQSLLDTDTQYNRVIIHEYRRENDRTVREMMIGNEPSSAMYLEDDELVYAYTKYYRLLDHFVPQKSSSTGSGSMTALMLGGAGYSYPKDFMRTHPDASMDIVEIDPALTDLAKEYFMFQPNEKIAVYHEDARTFLNREEKQYDAILNDAFSSHFSHPFQLATKEAIQHMYNMLTSDGVVITNTISTLEGERSKFMRAEYYTYKSIFPYVAIFPVTAPQDPYYLQNIMIIAAKKPLNFSSDNEEFKQYLSTRYTGEIVQGDLPILTDEYAPVEHYAANLLQYAR